jgi:hypothetical protein
MNEMNEKREILRALDRLIQDHGGPWDGLWEDLAFRYRALEAPPEASFADLVLADLEVIERRYGVTAESEAIRRQVCALSPAAAPPVPSRSGA